MVLSILKSLGDKVFPRHWFHGEYFLIVLQDLTLRPSILSLQGCQRDIVTLKNKFMPMLSKKHPKSENKKQKKNNFQTLDLAMFAAILIWNPAEFH